MSKILTVLFALLLAAILWRAGQAPMSPVPQMIAAVTIVAVFVHAASALGMVNALGFAVSIIAVTFAVENVGAFTGIPFGNYHFVVGSGLPHVGRIPLIVGFLYFGTGYCAFIAAVLITAGRSGAIPLLAAPVTAAFAMTQWDLVMDPVNSTLYGLWIWHDGGGFFGVPLTNFLGWFIEMLLAFLAAALFLNCRGVLLDFAGRGRSFWLMPILLYLAAGLSQVAPWLLSGKGEVTAMNGQAWPVQAIHDTAVLAALLTMLPTSLAAIYRLCRND